MGPSWQLSVCTCGSSGYTAWGNIPAAGRTWGGEQEKAVGTEGRLESRQLMEQEVAVTRPEDMREVEAHVPAVWQPQGELAGLLKEGNIPAGNSVTMEAVQKFLET